MPANPITFLVLGTGRMAHRHAAALARIRAQPELIDGEPVPVILGIYGRTPERLREIFNAYSADFTSDHLEGSIGRFDVDVVDNCLVNRLHYDPLMQAISDGKHVFTDKPLGATLEESEELLAAATAAGVRHGIIQNMRFQGGPQAAKAILESGDLGDVFHARVVFGYYVPPLVSNRPPWFFKREESAGGVVHDMMAHFYDLLGWLVGPVASTHCLTFGGITEREDPATGPFHSDVEDSCAVNLRFENGAIGQVFSSWVRRRHEDVPTIEIDCSRGGLLVTANRCWMQRGDGPLFSYDPAAEQGDPLDGWDSVPTTAVDPFEVQLRGFVRSVATGSDYTPDWHDALRTHRWVEAAYESDQSGREVSIQEN